MSQIMWRPVVLPSMRLERDSVNGVTDCENSRSMTCNPSKIERADAFFVYLELNPIGSTSPKLCERDANENPLRCLCLRQRTREGG